jgi:hypothetical protein
LGDFFHEKSFALVEIIFFRSKFGENSPLEESLVARVAIINNKICPQLVTEQSHSRFFQNTFIFWLPTIAEGRNLTIFLKINQNLENLGNCFQKTPLLMLLRLFLFFSPQNGKNSPQ